MQALGKSGVLVLSSVTGGNRMIEVPADRINLEFVLGNARSRFTSPTRQRAGFVSYDRIATGID